MKINITKHSNLIILCLLINAILLISIALIPFPQNLFLNIIYSVILICFSAILFLFFQKYVKIFMNRISSKWRVFFIVLSFIATYIVSCMINYCGIRGVLLSVSLNIGAGLFSLFWFSIYFYSKPTHEIVARISVIFGYLSIFMGALCSVCNLYIPIQFK